MSLSPQLQIPGFRMAHRRRSAKSAIPKRCRPGNCDVPPEDLLMDGWMDGWIDGWMDDCNVSWMKSNYKY